MVLAKLHYDHWLAESDVNPEQYLFHYTGVDSLEPILTNGTLKLNTLDGMNDPREKKPWVADGIVVTAGDMTDESLKAHGVVQAEPDRLLRQAARVACFTHERLPRSDAGKGTMFHRGWGRARMWHTYGWEHEGVCFVFDTQALGAAIVDARPPAESEVTAFFPIVYKDQPLTLPLYGAYETVEQMRDALDELTSAKGNGPGESPLNDLLFTKNTDWQSEDETRALIVLSPDEMNENELAGVPPKPIYIPYLLSLRAIVFGEDCSPPPEVVELADHRGVGKEDLARVNWYMGEPILQMAYPDPPKHIAPQPV